MDTEWIQTQQWVSNEKAKELIGKDACTLKRHANRGELVYGVHYIRLGKHKNSKYRWNAVECLNHYAYRNERTRPKSHPH